METVLITGGSGKIGRELISKIDQTKYDVRVLSRSGKPISACSVFKWDVDNFSIDKKSLENLDHIIHLAGSDVSTGRWTSSRKKEIRDSRIKSLSLIETHLIRPLKSFTLASGISIYGTRTTAEIFSENSEIENKSDDFLAQVSEDWEAAAIKFGKKAETTLILRTPVVLSRSGGALEKLKKPIKMGFGSALGDGKQWMPWVHIDDLIQAYIKGLEDHKFDGIYNVCAPEHISNEEFTRKIAATVGKKIWAPKVPAFILKAMFGEMSGIILNGSRVSGEKIEKTGLKYEYPTLELALTDLL